MFSAGPVEIGGDGTTVLATAFEPGTGFGPVIVPSWRQNIDLADPDASVGMNTTGQSGNPASPRYREMVEDWAAGEYHPLPFTRTAIEVVAAERLRLVPLSV
jgi:penicillin amidase